MICMRFVIQRHNQLRDLEAELQDMVCKDVATEPVLQDVEGEQLTPGRIKRRMQDWIYMHVVFGSPSDQLFLMSRFVTRTQSKWVIPI